MKEQIIEFVDVENILKPINDDNICGDDLDRSSVHHEIMSALNQQRFIFLESNQKYDVIELIRYCEEILKEKSKDLAVCLWLWEALCRKYGLEGVLQGIILNTKIVEKFGKQMYPHDNEKIEFCASNIDEKFSSSLLEIQIIDGRSICDHLREKKISAALNNSQKESLGKKIKLLDEIIYKMNEMSELFIKTFENKIWSLNKIKERLLEIKDIFNMYLTTDEK